MSFSTLFPGIGTFFAVEPAVAFARIFLILLGMVLAYLGFTRKLEPLIMVPMGVGMIAVNAGVLFLSDGGVGTLLVDPLVSDTGELMQILQVNCFQPIYNFLFSNGLIACLVFMGIGARSEISFLLSMPWSCIILALFGELGTFVTLILGIEVFGLLPTQAAAIATIGGADGPMVLFSSLIMSPELFVPISIIAYLYLSLTYGGYPYLIRLLIPKKYRGIDVEVYPPEVPQKTKVIFILVITLLLCLLLPMATPLMLSFFIGVLVKEADIGPYTDLLEEGVTYASTFFLGLVLGTLCEASTLLNPVVIKILILGILALLISGIGGLLGGWFLYFVKKKQFNPVIGIAGVSCVPTTAKLAQHAVEEENPFAMIIPVAMGANICGVITTAIAAGVFITTIGFIK